MQSWICLKVNLVFLITVDNETNDSNNRNTKKVDNSKNAAIYFNCARKSTEIGTPTREVIGTYSIVSV